MTDEEIEMDRADAAREAAEAYWREIDETDRLARERHEALAQDGRDACMTGAWRRAPEGLSDGEASAWLRGWDEKDSQPRLSIDIEMLSTRRARWHVERVRSGKTAYLSDEIEQCEHKGECPVTCVWSIAVRMIGA